MITGPSQPEEGTRKRKREESGAPPDEEGHQEEIATGLEEQQPSAEMNVNETADGPIPVHDILRGLSDAARREYRLSVVIRRPARCVSRDGPIIVFLEGEGTHHQVQQATPMRV